MATLLQAVNQTHAPLIDAHSNGGQILKLLSELATPAGAPPRALLAEQLSLGLTTGGSVTVRPATAGDVFIFSVPATEWNYSLVEAAGQVTSVEIELHDIRIKIPGVRRAREDGEVLKEDGAGDIALVLPSVLLIVDTPAGSAAAGARIGPSRVGGAIQAAVEPQCFLLGPSTVLGFKVQAFLLELDNPPGARLRAPQLEVFVSPAGMPTLAAHGGGRDLLIELGTPGGLSGDLTVAAAAQTTRPSYLRDVKIHAKLNRNSIVLLELTGKADLDAAISAKLGTSIKDMPRDLSYRLALTLPDGASDWTASLRLEGGGPEKLIWRSNKGVAFSKEIKRDTLGAYVVFAPLLNALPAAGSNGYMDLALGGGLAAGMAASGVVTTQQVTVYGAELVVAKDAGGTDAMLFFDVESVINVDVPSLLKTKHPLRVRQKAVGFKLDSGEGQLHPVFDPDKGFKLDLSDPGTFDIAQPLGNFLQPDNPRIARENPLLLEITLTPKAKLGVVTLESGTARIPLEGGGAPSLTALGAKVNLGAITGRGYLRILENGVEGGADLTLGKPLDMRIAADLSVQGADGFTAVLLGIDVRWPVAIPIANSGLGLFGLLGLLGVNLERKVLPDQTSLDWYRSSAPDYNVAAHGERLWLPVEDAWAFGVGAVVGTVEGGYLINAKGLLILELPGPRVALFMQADIIKQRPPVAGAETGTLLAVIEISPQSILLGVIVKYEIPFLLKVQVPAEAFFQPKQPEDWHLDVGKNTGPRASVSFMTFIRADGYLMIHGNGIAGLVDNGFAVAAGIEAALTWGLKDLGLYVRVSVGADVVMAFKPIYISGHLEMSGELHLFIVSVGASASAELTITEHQFYVRAAFTGHVDFFFFSVEGTVTFELGTLGLAGPAADPMLRSMSLVSRNHAFLEGTGADADRPIDGNLGDASSSLDGGAFAGNEPVVPIDTIPILHFETAPHVGTSQFFGQQIAERVGPTGWSRRGARRTRYNVQSLTLKAFDGQGNELADPLLGTDRPATWLNDFPASTHPNTGDDVGAQLALLSWAPTATPAASIRTLDRSAADRRHWGTVCLPVAPATPILWTFRGQQAGSSATGWSLNGIAWPDPPGTTRLQLPDLDVAVVEPWRSGNPIADALVAVTAAYIAGAADSAERVLVCPKTDHALRPRTSGVDPSFDDLFASFKHVDLEGLADAIRIDARGLRRVRGLMFTVDESANYQVRGRKAGGASNGFEANIDHFVSGLNQVPNDWNWTRDPWRQPVQAALDAALVTLRGYIFGLRIFDLDLPDGTAAIDIGINDDNAPEWNRWGLIVFEGLTEAEFLREEFDRQHRESSIALTNNALGDASTLALLRPGTSYAVEVTYTVQSADADKIPAPEAPQPEEVEHHQTFRFKTDANPPQKLETFVLATSPREGDIDVFFEDVIQVVFINGAVRKLYNAYGIELFGTVRAASGKHPAPPHGQPGDEIKLSALQAVALPAQIFTPFESSLREAMATTQSDCVPEDKRVGTPHDMLPIALPLEASTGYVLDIEGKDSAGAVKVGGGRYPALRRNFTTSRYGSAAAFAADVNATAIRHRHIGIPDPLVNLGVGTVADPTFEVALRAADWGNYDRPHKPRVTVLWRGATDSQQQPFAIYIETAESAWRSRGLPEEVSVDPETKVWKMVPKPWLELTSPSAIAGFVHTSSGMRTLVLLGNNARGTTVKVELKRIHDSLYEGTVPAPPPAQVLQVTLNAAPWEASQWL